MVREEKTENKNSISEESKTFESIASEEKILLIDNISNKFIYINYMGLPLQTMKNRFREFLPKFLVKCI